MTRVDALDEVNFSMVVGRADQVGARLVERHGVKRGQNADVYHLRVFGRGVAVTVDRQVVRHTDIEDSVAAMVGHSFGCLSHRFEKSILLGQVVPEVGFRLAGRMDIGFTRGRGDADGHVLDGSSETAHGVPFEMRKHDSEIIVEVVFPHVVGLQVLASLDGQSHLALCVHNIDRRNGSKAVIAGRLHVILDSVALSGVGRVALDQCAVHLFHKPFNQIGV